MHRATVIGLLLAAVLLPTCTPEGDGASESSGPVWSEDTRWVIDEVPDLRIGSWEESSETFDQIRVATFLAPHRMAVVDRTTEAVRVFDPSGSLSHTIGREGEGPGEFRRVNAVWVRGDTVVVADNGLGRINHFDSTGAYLHHTAVPRDMAPRTFVIGAFPDGNLVLERPGAGSRLVSKAGPLPADSVRWFAASPSLESTTLLATGVLREAYGHPWGSGIAMNEVMFTPTAHAAVVGDELVLARGGRAFEVEVIGGDGRLRETFGYPFEPRPTTPDGRARYIAWRLEHAPRRVDLAAWQRVFDESPMKETFPSSGDVLSDPDGNIWVEHYTPLWGRELWAVFGPERRWLGDVEMPPGMRLLEVQSERVVGAHVDDLGVETAVVHALMKPGSGAPEAGP